MKKEDKNLKAQKFEKLKKEELCHLKGGFTPKRDVDSKGRPASNLYSK